MKLHPTVKIDATVTITDREAEVLHHLTSYGVIKLFAEGWSHKFAEAEINAALSAIRDTTGRIVSARNRALNLLAGISEGA